MLLAAAHESDYGPLTDLAQCPLSCRFQGISRRQVRAQPVHNLKLCRPDKPTLNGYSLGLAGARQ